MSVFEILRILWRGFPVAAEFLNPDYPAAFQLIGGLQLSIVITLISHFCAVLPGLLLALLRQRISGNASSFPRITGGVFAAVSTVITEIIRGIPVMTLVLLVFLPSLFIVQPESSCGSSSCSCVHGLRFCVYERGYPFRLSCCQQRDP